MTTKTVDSKQARNQWGKMLDIVLDDDTDIVITRYNKPIVTVVAYEDYLLIRDELQRYRAEKQAKHHALAEALGTMLATEHVLAREWNTTEEDEAWEDL